MACPDSFLTIRTVSLPTGHFWANKCLVAKTFRIYKNFPDSNATTLPLFFWLCLSPLHLFFARAATCKTTLTWCEHVSNLYFLHFLLFPGSVMRKTKLFLYCHLSTFSLSGKLQNNFNLCQCFYIFCPLFFSLGQSCIGGIVGKSVFASGSLFFEAEFS